MTRVGKILESLKSRKTISEAWTKKSIENLKERILSDLKLVVEDEYENQKDDPKVHPQSILYAAEQRTVKALDVVYKIEKLVSRAEYNAKRGIEESPEDEIEEYTSALEDLTKSKDKVYPSKLFPTVEQVLGK